MLYLLRFVNKFIVNFGFIVSNCAIFRYLRHLWLITTTLATMKINSKLGMKPVTFSEIVQEEEFWAKCKSCIHYTDLKNAGFKNCFCTAMLYDPIDNEKQNEPVRLDIASY